MQALSSIICTVFYVGLIPFAPGTFGTIAGVIFALFMGFDVILMTITLSMLFIIGYVFSDIYAQRVHKTDPKEVVIDEVVGVLITLVIAFTFCDKVLYFYLPIEFSCLVGYNQALYYDSVALLSTVLFRFFDILKPGIIKKIDEKVVGGMGIMMDDVVAGIFAGITFIIIAPFCLLMLKIFSY